MPCSDVRPGDREFEHQCYLFWKALGEDMCNLMKHWEGHKSDLPEPPKEMLEWWEAHKEWDKIREAQE